MAHNSHGENLYNEILKHPELGYRCDGVYSFNSKNKSISVPYLGKFSDLEESFLVSFDRIFFSQKLNISIQEKIIKTADSFNI